MDGSTLNMSDAGALIGVGPATIRYWILSGVLSAEKVGGRWQIKKKDLEEANEAMASRSRGPGRGPRGHLVRESKRTGS